MFTRDLVKPKPGERWLLVTSATHMPRSIGAFRQAGFPVIPYPVNYRTNGRLWSLSMPSNKLRALQLVDQATHEWLGLAALLADRQDRHAVPGALKRPRNNPLRQPTLRSAPARCALISRGSSAPSRSSFYASFAYQVGKQHKAKQIVASVQ